MSYELWMHGQKVGTTRFELRPASRKRAGLFQPTAFGLRVLPGITGMTRALLDFGDMCRRNGVDTDDSSPECGERALATFGTTPEGQRVIAAARQIAELELRDADGATMPWESIAVSDVNDLIAAAERLGATPPQPKTPNGDPIRYLITVTLKDERGTPASTHAHPQAATGQLC